MLDIELIRTQTDLVRERLRTLNDPKALEYIDKILELDVERRQLITDVQTYKQARNTLSKGAGKLRGNKSLDDAVRIATAIAVAQAVEASEVETAIGYLDDPASTPSADGDDVGAAFDQLFAALKQLGNQVTAMDDRIREVETELNDYMLWVPNLPHESTLVGASESDNKAEETQGNMRKFAFKAKAHWDLGPELNIIDFERGVKLSGTRFYILKHNGARLYRAMINWLLDEHYKLGFQELYVPYMVKEDALYGSAQFPKFRDVVYFDNDAELYLLPTAEVAVTNMFADEILEEADLPMHYVAHTPCFRREKMSAGRDVRGIKRVHQFEKVELYKFTTPETSYDEMESLIQAVETVAKGLDIPYRRLEIATGDLGFSATKKFDIEMYAPGCGEWLEVSSVSNTEDFQARRANVRYRPTDGGKPRFVHTLNGSALGMTRALIAVMENYQQDDGSIAIPEVLRPYMGGLEAITP